MARPTKNNCDYFPHDSGMRNHKKVKAIRSKFGISGYAIWSMILEHLTGSDGNVFPYTDLEFELMSGDFGISATEIRGVVDYCISLELIFNKKGFISSESLDERLAPVYEKRGKAKELSKNQLRDNGKFASSNPDSTVVSVTEMPQSKVKEIEVNKTEVKESMDLPASLKKSFDWWWSQCDEIWLDNIRLTHKGKDVEGAAREAHTSLLSNELRLCNTDLSGFKGYVNSWLSNKKQDNGIRTGGKSANPKTSTRFSGTGYSEKL